MNPTALPPSHVVRETIVSILVNAALSGVVYFAFFHDSARIPIWGIGNFLFDFAPQSLMIGLMGSLVPGLLAAKSRRRDGLGTVPVIGIVWRAVGFALTAMVLGTSAAAAMLYLLGLASIAFAAGLAVKTGYGALLAASVTPVFLRTQIAR